MSLATYGLTIEGQCCHHVGTSKLSHIAILLMGTLALKELRGMFFSVKPTQPAIACSKLTIETLEQDVKYV